MITGLSLGTGGLGRFGNQLFLAASVIGIAIKSGQPFAFPHWKNYDNALFGQPIDDMEDYFINPLPRLPEGLLFEQYPYFWDYRDLFLPTGNWNMFAHLQSVKYFSHCLDTVRHYLRMKNEPDQNDYVSIHYRAGDYIDDPNAYHPRCSIEYYNDAKRQFPANTKYLLFSDDAVRAAELFNNAGWNFDVSKMENGTSYLQDFAIMKKCKSFICANSSYSHMAALLGEHPDKKIILPRKWFGAAADGCNFDTLYPPEAIVI